MAVYRMRNGFYIMSYVMMISDWTFIYVYIYIAIEPQDLRQYLYITHQQMFVFYETLNVIINLHRSELLWKIQQNFK